MNCKKRHALQHSSFAAPPGDCNLLSTVQVQPVRATTPFALSWKNGARRHGKVRPVRLEWFTLCCAACGQRRSCGTAGTLGTRQTCASWRAWDRSLCGEAWSLHGVAKKRVGAPPACSRSTRVVCEGRRLETAATDCELAASSRADIWMTCAV